MEKLYSEWVRCPICGNKTRTMIRKDTELINFPLYCPKCKQESLISVKNLQVTVIKNLNLKRRVDEQRDRFGVKERKMDD